MKYFKDDSGSVFAYAADGSQDDFIAAELTPITEAEADQLRKPKLSKAQVWEFIKAERDRRTEYGGCLVDGRWYDTDSRSALRYKLLADQAAADGVSDDTVVRAGWRPLDVEQKGEVDMTYGLLRRIMAAGIAAAMAIDDAAEQHKAAMLRSADPADYDYSGGWPDAYGDEAVQ
jgi:hypothetical protein